MNRRHIVSFASVFTPAAIGLAVALAAPTGASASTRDASAGSTTAAAPAAASKLILLGCKNNPEVAPTGIFDCKQPNLGLRALHWTSWTPHLASGFGTYVLSTSKGHVGSYPALVDLWGSAAVKGHPGEHKYAAMTIIFTGTPPTFSQVVNGKSTTVQPGTLTFPTSP